MKLLLFSVVFLAAIVVNGQTTVHIDVSERNQIIHGIGASDAWNFDPVGKYWSNNVKEDIAQRLFSRDFDNNGNPMGIGLSRWRFNIGGGSAEQGDQSNIEMPERRVELFLNADGTYNWNKQAGQQWFLSKANNYGVESLVAFVNSPPRFYTRSGRANSNDYGGSTNLKSEHFDDYANFLVDVLEHFKEEGISFSQISPVNEPQYPWRDGQEGSPWMNSEIKSITEKLNSAIVERELDTRILIAESESYRVLYEGGTNYPGRDNQIHEFFNPSGAHYIGNLSQVDQGIAGHGYWMDGSDSEIISSRKSLAQKAAQENIEVYQTEYCLLSRDFNTKLQNSIFLGKMIHAELAIANASIYDYWTAIERERWSQRNRFYLIRLRPSGGDYADLENGGTITVDKNLWVLGNFSRFIRPGYQRIGTPNAESLAGLMSSAYISPDNSEIVVVHVNWGEESQSINHFFHALPNGKSVQQIIPYLTDATNSLSRKTALENSDAFLIPGRSVTTMVVQLKDSEGDDNGFIINEQVLLSGEVSDEPIIYHDFAEWAKDESDKIPAWYVHYGENNYTIWTDNPDQEGINSSATSLLAETTTSVDWWGNFLVFRLNEPIMISEENRYLHIMHYREFNNYGWSVHLNTETPYEDASLYSGTLRFDGGNLEDGQWEDIVIDLSHLIENEIPFEKFMLIVDKAWYQDKNSVPTSYYFDEIVLNNSPFARTNINTRIYSEQPIKEKVLVYVQNRRIFVECSNLKSVRIYDIHGRLVFSGAANDLGQAEINVNDSGVYLLRMIANNHIVITDKIVVK